MRCHIYVYVTKDFYFISLAELLPSWIISAMKQAAMLEKPNGAGTGGGPWAIVCREFGHAHNYMSLEVHPSPAKPSDDYRPLAYSLGEILKERTQVSHAQIPDPQKLRINSCVSHQGLDFCYATVEY